MKRAIIALCVFASVVSISEAASKKNYKIAREYLEECENNKTIPAVGSLGSKVVQKYWDTVPELKALREQFIIDNDAFTLELKKDDDYRKAYEAYESSTGSEQNRALRELSKAKGNAYSRLGNDKDFKKALAKRQKSLSICNIKTLEYIISDYEKKNQPFPIDWIEK
jgi:hypothetical protein